MSTEPIDEVVVPEVESPPEAITPEGEAPPIAQPETPNLAQASSPPSAPAPEVRDPTQDEEPTYRVEPWSGLTRYVCLLDGHEDWSLETFSQHAQVYHRGIMREAPPGPNPEESPEATVEEGETPAAPASTAGA